jgi:hypothetical protein
MTLRDTLSFRHTVDPVRYLLRQHPAGADLVVFAVTSLDVAIVAELDESDLLKLGAELLTRGLAMRGAAYLAASTEKEELPPWRRVPITTAGGLQPDREPESCGS